MRCAICRFVERYDEGFRIHKFEYIEADEVANAVQCMQKLHKFCKSTRPSGTLSDGVLD